MYSCFEITQTAATVAALMGFEAPKDSAPQNPVVYDKAMAALPANCDRFDRVLLYNPDAIAWWLYQKYTALFSEALLRSDLQIPVGSVMPSVTPVCFASMYSGVMPDKHGIKAYKKPVLTCDTLFDAAIRAGKRCAIVSTAGDSISCIFLSREMDYFLYPTYEEVLAKALELIKEDQYDLLVVYNATYDATMHKVGPESELALSVLKQNAADFAKLVDAVKEHWQGHNSFYGFCPDHGCHEIDGGCGSHGLDMEEDMNVIHLFGTATGKVDF